MDTSSISFTALYTGHVWYEHGLSAPFFTSKKSRLMYWGMQPAEKMTEFVFGTNLSHILLQRHHIMDYRINQLIDDGVTQVLEIACGLSPRGHMFTKTHPDINYIEADLPDMAKQKAALLDSKNAFGKNHRVIACNILESGAPYGLDHILRKELDPTQKTVVITEGLINYFSREALTPFWKTLAEIGKEFPEFRYFADCYPVPKGSSTYRWIIGPMKFLGAITNADVNPLFDSAEHAESYLQEMGFSNVVTHNPEDYYTMLDIPRTRNHAITRVIEAQA